MDEDHGAMFGMKLRDVLQQLEDDDIKPSESAEDIRNRMIEKSLRMSGN